MVTLVISAIALIVNIIVLIKVIKLYSQLSTELNKPISYTPYDPIQAFNVPEHENI